MSFLNDLGNTTSRHLESLLIVPFLLLPGLIEKLFIEGVPLWQADIFILLLYAAVVGFSLLVLCVALWIAEETLTDPHLEEDKFFVDSVSNAVTIPAVCSALLASIDFVLPIQISPRLYWLIIGAVSLLLPLVLIGIALIKRRLKHQKARRKT